MGAKKMNLVLTLAIAFLFGAARCYGELRFNCSDKKIFLSKQFSLYYDTINPLHEVMIQKSLHKLRSAIGEKATVSRLAPRDSMELELEAALLEANEEMAVNEGTFRKLSRRIKSFGEKIKPKPKPVTTKHVTEPHHHTTEPHHHGTEPHHHTTEPHHHTTEPHHHTTEPHHHTTEPNHHTTEPHHHTTEPHHHTTEPHHHTTEPHHHTTSPHHHTTEPHHETTTQHETTPNPPPQTTTSEPTSNPESTTTPRPAPVVTTTTQFVPDTTTTPEGRRTTQSVPDTTTTPEGRRTTSTQTTTPERRRTTSTQTTTPERRRTTAALPVVIDLELEVDMGRGASLLVTVDGRARQDRKFELVIDAPMTRLTADSLPGAIRGLEVMGQLMGTNQNGDKYLPVCRVH